MSAAALTFDADSHTYSYGDRPAYIRTPRSEAIASGLQTYVGRPCRHGHTVRRVHGMCCLECERRRYAAKTPGQLTRLRETRKAYYLNRAKPKYQPIERARSFRAEAKALGLKRYSTGAPCPLGHVVERLVSNGSCMECCRVRQSSDHSLALRRRWASSNLQQKLAKKRWQIKNKPLLAAHCARRKAHIRRTTPAWLTADDHDAMRAMYAEAARLTIERGEPYHIDHIVPLRGRNVCGLHVPANLQVLRGADNYRKSNRHADV